MAPLLFFLLVVPAFCAPCVPEQFAVGLTQCSLNKTRSAIFTGNGTCDNPPPSPVTGLTCDLDCPPGTFLGYDRSLRKSLCELCPANTFSNGGGVRFAGSDESWHKLASHFITYCYVSELYSWIFKKDCDSWTPTEDGTSLVSGNTTRRAWAQSELIYYADIVKAGKLTIEYRKKTRMYNGGLNGIFEVFINEKSVHEDANLGNESWQTFSVALPTGMTEIVIIYEKYNAAGFEDLHANIRMIEVRGTAINSLSCQKCPSGFSLPGSDECSACRANEYFDSGVCQGCPPTTYSPAGSKSLDSCKPKPPCTESDYRQEFTGCLNGSTTKHYEWILPHICDEVAGVKLPNAELGQPCEPCSPGNYQKHIKEGDVETKCASCPPGTASNGTEVECTVCPEGHFAPRLLNYSVWTSLPSEVSNDCRPYTGQTCSDSSGWQPSSNGLTSGVHLTTNCYLTLALYTNIVETNSFFQFQWSMTKNKTSGSQLMIEIDGNLVVMHNSNEYRSVSRKFALGVGGRVIRLVYHHVGSAEDSCTIHWLVIKGSDLGGAPVCEECSPGFFSAAKSASCSMCPAGFTNNAEKSQCVMCPENAYSDVPGNPEGCVPCPANTRPNFNHTQCIGPANLTLGHVLYPIENLTGLRDGADGYVQGLCLKEKFALFCSGPFYGPIRTAKDDFYVSVLNPAKLSLDAFHHYDNKSVGYAYGIINREELNTEHIRVPDEPCVSDFSKMIVNLGSKVGSVSIGDFGFNVSYVKGSECRDSQFSSDIVFLCDKKEAEGFPELLEAAECHYTFVWRTRLACQKCSPAQMSVVRGACVNGARYVYYVEGRNCSLHTQDKESLYMLESCTEMGEVLSTTVALIVVGMLTLLLLAAGVLGCCFCKVSKQYQRLLQNQGDARS